MTYKETNLFMRKLILLYIALTLSLSPMASYAAAKKSHKHASSSAKATHAKFTNKKSNKYKLIKYKTNSQASNRKVNLRLRAHKAEMVYAQAYDGSGPLLLASSKALVINQLTGETIYAKNTNQSTPIASVTKLMTAMVMLDAHLPMDDLLLIADEDVDYLKGTRS